MDYLVQEGYQAAAEEFSKEADVSTSVDFSSISTRMSIREAVQRGDVEQAIELVNDLNPEVSSDRPIGASRRTSAYLQGMRQGLNLFMHHSQIRASRIESVMIPETKTSVFNMIPFTPQSRHMHHKVTDTQITDSGNEPQTLFSSSATALDRTHPPWPDSRGSHLRASRTSPQG